MLYTENTNKLLNLATKIAQENGAKFIGSDHLLYAMFYLNDPVKQVLKSFISISCLTDRMHLNLGYDHVQGLSIDAKNVLQSGENSAISFGYTSVIPLHVLYGILDPNVKNRAASILYMEKVNLAKIRLELTSIFSSYKNKDTSNNQIQNIKKDNQYNAKSDSEATKDSDINVLDFLTDITLQAKNRAFDNIVGRDNEIERAIQILARRTKNNPILVGEPGVGKTAIVQGIASRLVSNDIPDVLINKRLMSVDLPGMIAGSQYRGQFEERLKALVDYVLRTKDVILFIDEIHTIVGAGATDQGAMDAANILKPLLTNGDLSTIGSTTLEEYHKYIEKDPAFERRFMPLTINPPSEESAIIILKNIRKKFEKHHMVKISDEAIMSAVTLSNRYITDRFLPDKAIDLIDEASAKVSMNGRTDKNVKELRKEIFELEKEKKSAILIHNASKILDINAKIQRLNLELEDRIRIASLDNDNIPTVNGEDVAQVISTWTRIPLDNITTEESKKLIDLESELKKQIIGQDKAIAAVSRAIRRARAGFKDKTKPIGSFLFVGPTGVGKTELSKALANVMFSSERDLLRFDMSEYMDKSSVARLIGAAPGLVGFEEGGQLTEAVRRKPYCILLFDEIEKANREILNLFLQILDDGHLTDSQGRTVDFSNVLIIFTSNIGAQYAMQISNAKTSADRERAYSMQMDALKSAMKPEFLNRLDDVIVFNALDKNAIAKISSLLIKKLAKKLREDNIDIVMTRNVIEYIIDKGYQPEYGARPLKRAIQTYVMDEISDMILRQEVHKFDTIYIDYDGKKLKYSASKSRR